jgi:hypothetical protein
VPGLARRCTRPAECRWTGFQSAEHFVTVGDLGGAGDHDPVLSAVVVFLQAQAGLGLDLNALDLEAAAFVDAVVPAPGAVHFAVQGVLFAFWLRQLGHDVLDVLAARLVGDQHGVSGFDDDQVVTPTRLTKRLLACTRVLWLSVVSTSPTWALPCSSLGSTLPHRVPGAQVAPAGVEGTI